MHRRKDRSYSAGIAGPTGEIMVSTEAARHAPALMAKGEIRMLTLKGIGQPVEARVLRMG